jgi:hypothetical protein
MADEVVASAALVDLAWMALCALINWTYLSRKVDLGSANDHGKSAGSDLPDHSISRYDFDQEISNHWGFPFPWEVDHAVGTRSSQQGLIQQISLARTYLWRSSASPSSYSAGRMASGSFAAR